MEPNKSNWPKSGLFLSKIGKINQKAYVVHDKRKIHMHFYVQ